jgi:hypothetical protein
MERNRAVRALAEKMPKLPDSVDAECSRALNANGHQESLDAVTILACLGREVGIPRQGAHPGLVWRPCRPGQDVPEHKRLGYLMMKFV